MLIGVAACLFSFSSWGNDGDPYEWVDDFTDSIVLLMHLDEVTGATSFRDSSGTGNTGSCTNCPVTGLGGKFDSAISYDGNNDVINVADAASLDITTSITISGWITAPGSHPSYAAMLAKSADGSWADGYGVYFDGTGSSLCFYVGEWDGTGDGANACATYTHSNDWSHIVGVYNSGASTAAIYFNGISQASTNKAVSIDTNNATLQIGKGRGTATQYVWNGDIDEVMIADTALTRTQVEAFYRLSLLRRDSQGYRADGFLSFLRHPYRIF